MANEPVVVDETSPRLVWWLMALFAAMCVGLLGAWGLDMKDTVRQQAGQQQIIEMRVMDLEKRYERFDEKLNRLVEGMDRLENRDRRK